MDLGSVVNQITRLIATLGIWGFLTIILTNAGDSSNVVWMAIVLGIGAAVSTGFIWANELRGGEPAAAKTKRSTRMSKIVNKLDDDEVAELADLLIAREESRLVSSDRRSQRLSE